MVGRGSGSYWAFILSLQGSEEVLRQKRQGRQARHGFQEPKPKSSAKPAAESGKPKKAPKKPKAKGS